MTIDLKLNNGDLYFGKTYIVDGIDKVNQQVKVILKWFLGEWKFDKTIGIPYFQEILGKVNPDYIKIFSLIKFEIEKIENVLKAEIIDYNFEEINRLLIFNIVVNTTFGNLIINEKIL